MPESRPTPTPWTTWAAALLAVLCVLLGVLFLPPMAAVCDATKGVDLSRWPPC